MPQAAYADLLKRAESGNVTIHMLKDELAKCEDRSVRLKVLMSVWEHLADEETRTPVSRALRRCEADLAKAMKTPLAELT